MKVITPSPCIFPAMSCFSFPVAFLTFSHTLYFTYLRSFCPAPPKRGALSVWFPAVSSAPITLPAAHPVPRRHRLYSMRASPKWCLQVGECGQMHSVSNRLLSERCCIRQGRFTLAPRECLLGRGGPDPATHFTGQETEDLGL